MGGFSNITGDQFKTVVNADNASFDGTPRGGVLSQAGEIWIGRSTLNAGGTYIDKNRLTAGTGIAITNGDGSITISASAVGLTWQTITASQTLVVNNGYFCISPGGALSLALPATSSVGDIIEISLDGATSFTVTQAAGQQIRMGTLQTTLGVGGTLATNAQGDTLRLVCSVANLKWNVMSSMGNFTVV